MSKTETKMMTGRTRFNYLRVRPVTPPANSIRVARASGVLVSVSHQNELFNLPFLLFKPLSDLDGGRLLANPGRCAAIYKPGTLWMH